MKLNKKGKNSTDCKVITKTYNQIKRKRIRLIVPLIVLFMLICVIGMIIIGINQNNKNGQMIADMEETSDDILAIERAAAGQSWTYGATGGVQVFTVPTTGRYTFTVSGAAGGDGYYKEKKNDGSWDEFYTAKINGTTMTGKIKLTQGTVLYLFVGTRGSGANGGWNGGGTGAGNVKIRDITYQGTTYSDDGGSEGYSGGGGGASDIRLGGTGLENRILVAPGGPGGGCSMYVDLHIDSHDMNRGGHANAAGIESAGNGQISGRGSDYITWDASYMDDSSRYRRRVVYSGGGGGGYYGGETLLIDDLGQAVKTLGPGRRTQDTRGFAGTSYYNASLVTDTASITRYSSIYSDVAQTNGTNNGNGYITITLEHEHTYTVVSRTEPTCLEQGVEVRRCTICGDEITVIIPALGGPHAYTVASRTEPTCLAQGLEVSRCTICNHEIRTPIPALGHNAPATYSYATNNGIENGLRYKNCTRCNTRLESAYLLSLNKGYGIASVSGGGTYYAEGASVTAGATLTSGYKWVNWTGASTSANQSFTFAMPGNAITLTANGRNPTYRVNHNIENLDGTGYTVRDTEGFDAKPNTKVTPKIKYYTGFITPPVQTATVLGDESTVVNYNYERRKDLTYTVSYIEKETNEYLREPKTVTGQTFEREIDTSREVIQIYGYKYDSINTDKLKITTGENIINIYYTKKDTSVTAHHYIYDAETKQYTTVKLAEDQVIRGKVGDSYRTSKTSQYLTNYKCIDEAPVDYQGIMTEDAIEVKYYYELIKPTIESSIEVKPTVKAGYVEQESKIPVLTRENGSVKYDIKYTANIEHYIGKAKVDIVVKLPANIDTTKSNIGNGTYNASTHTITWTEEITGINTTEHNPQKIEISKQIEVVYTEQDVTKNLVTQAGGKITTYYPEIHSSKQGQELVNKTISGEAIVKQDYRVNYKVQKIWEDNNNIEGKRPENITVKIVVMPYNQTITKILNAGNNWTYEETGLAKYAKETGQKITYTITEQETNENDLEYYEEEAKISNTENQTDEVTSYSYTITNKYRELETTLDTEITKTGAGEITSSKDEVNYTINFKAEIGEYIGEGKIKIVDELPYEIDEEKSDIAGGIYNKEAKTITWEEELPHMNTFNPRGELALEIGTITRKEETNTYEIRVQKQIKLVYKDIDLSQAKMANRVKGKIELYNQDTEDETSSEGVETNINVNGKVIVKYVDKETNEEIIKRERTNEQTYGYEITEKVGTNYNTEPKEIENYDYIESTNNETGTIEEGTIEVIYYYTRSQTKVIVKYQDTEGNEIADREEIEGRVWDTYRTEQKEIENYRFVRATENTEGTMTKQPIEVIYTYEKIPARVTVKYIEKTEEGDKNLLPEETIEGNVGDEYNTQRKPVENYRAKAPEPENARGKMTEEPIEVIYYYEKIPTKVIIKYVDETGETIKTEEIEGFVGDEYEIEPKEIENYEIIEEPENTKGTMTEEPKEITYTYKKIESKVTVKYIEKTEEGERELLPEEIIEGHSGDEYETQRKPIANYRAKAPEPENAKGKMTKEPIEVTYYYEKIPAKVIVKYVYINTEEEIVKRTNAKAVRAMRTMAKATRLENETYGYEINGYLGDEYETEEKEIPLYRFVKSTQNVKGTMEEEIIEVIYYYEKIPAKVIIKYVDETGEVIKTEEIEGFVGDEYEIIPEDMDNYKPVETPENPKGTMTEEPIEVICKYERIPSKIKVKYVDIDTEEEIIYKEENGEDKTYGYEIEGYAGEEYETKEKEIPLYNYIRSTENTKGKLTKEEATVIYYYRKKAPNFSIKETIDRITLNGKDIEIPDDKLVKIELKPSEIKNAELIVDYKVTVKNEGDLEGKVKVYEKIPEGYEIADMGKDWTINEEGLLEAEVELKPGESKDLKIVLRWKNDEKNLGTITNIVRLGNGEYQDGNPEDDVSEATVVISVKTGEVVSNLIILMIVASFGICIYIMIALARKRESKINGIKTLNK